MSSHSQQAPAGAMAVLYLEGGRLHFAQHLSDGERRMRVRDASGQVRKLERAKVLGKLPADAVAATIDLIEKQAQALDMAQVWADAAGDELDTATLARRCLPAVDSLHREAALLLAHAKDGGFFRFRKEAWEPVSAEQCARVVASREARARASAIEGGWQATLAAGQLPAELAAYLDAYMDGDVDTDSHCHRFLQRWCSDEGMGIAQLAVKWGRVTDFEEYHTREIRRRLAPPVADPGAPDMRTDLAATGDGALSLDASGTVEIDDAFSVGSEPHKLCVHIAAPALGMLPAAREQAMARMATLYLPGAKHMMLPDATVAAYSLAAGTHRPCVTLELDWDDEIGRLAGHRFGVGMVGIATNLEIERCAGSGHPDLDAQGQALLGRLEAVVADVIPARERHPGGGHLVTMADGAPHLIDRAAFLKEDRVVAGMMVLYNRLAASHLDRLGVPYLARRSGHVNVASTAGQVAYGWFTSPLRRYADLVNQEQLLATLNDTPPPYDKAALAEIVTAFNRQHAWLMQIQQRLELYWSLRWLEGRMDRLHPGHMSKQSGRVRLASAPVTVSVPPDARPAGQQVDVRLERLDPYSLQAWGTLA